MQYLKKGVLFFFVCSVMLSGCATVPRVAVDAQQSLKEMCQQSSVEFFYDPVTRSAKIGKDGEKIFVLVGSDVVMIGTEKVSLNAPVVLKEDKIYVSADFREKVMCRLDTRLCAGGPVKRGRTRIMIDPGHGGKDPGAKGVYGLEEKDIVLDIAQRLERVLENNGYDVRLVRTSDVFVSLEERTEKAVEWEADLYVSIHANSSTSSRAAGFEVWAPRELLREDFSEEQHKKNQRIVFGQLNMQKNNLFLEKTLEDMFYQHKYQQSLALASDVSKGFSKGMTMKNRGVKQSGFFVLRNTLVPSVLIEVGFLSNSREANRLRTTSYRQEIAEMLAEGIKDYARGL
jgi:N-acetylmuramoyl-L-alanine amidase